MKRGFTMAVLSLGMAWGGPASAAESCSEEITAVAPRLRVLLGIGEQATEVLTLDHASGAWALYKLSQAAGSCTYEPLAVDTDGAPKVTATRTPRSVVVVNTNALLYSIADKKAEDVTREDVADLQAAVALIGAAVPEFLGLPKLAGDFRVLAVAPPLSPEEQVGQAMSTWANDHGTALTALAAAAKAVGEEDGTTADGKRKFILAVQEFEKSGRVGSLEPVRVLAAKPLAGKALAGNRLEVTREALSKLEDALGSVSPLPCRAQLDALSEMFQIAARSPHSLSDMPAMRARRKELQDVLTKAKDCGPTLEVIQSIADGLPDSALDKEWPESARWLPLRMRLLAYHQFGNNSDARTKGGEALLGKSAALIAVAASVDQAVQRVESVYRGAKSEFVGDMLLVTEPWERPEWHETRTISFKVAATAPFADEIVKFHPAPLAASYRVDGRGWSADVGFGLVLAFGGGIRSPTFDAVADPTDATKKAIARTAEASRSGAPTLLLTLQHPRWRASDPSPGIDLGVGLDPDRLFVSLGVSVKLASFLRLGVGHAWHQVKELTPPQTELRYDRGALDRGSVFNVSSADDIQTADAIGKGWHLSLVLTISKLNPFKPAK